jgi:hypothetical protein
MPTDKSFRTVQGGSTPTQKGAEYAIKRYPATKPHETKDAPPGQARSPKPVHLGASRGVAAGGARVPEGVNRSSHSRAWGLKGK